MTEESSGYPEGDSSLESKWYEIASGEILRQCDILLGCPILRIAGKLQWPIPQAGTIPLQFETYNSIILTQSCDLENEKVEDILLAQVIAWPTLVHQELQRNNQFVKSKKYRKALMDGDTPGQALLHQHDGGPRLDWSIVSFQRVYTVQKDFLHQFASHVGPRLRLRSPYREHIAQAFARFVMRVGLPYDAKAFEIEGDVKT
jgi:hypothetical protein